MPDLQLSFIEVVNRLKFLNFVKTTSEDQRESRLKGKFKHLCGRIYSQYKDQYSPNGHLVKPFKIPSDWQVTVMIDFHLAIEQAVGFYTVDPMGRKYLIDEIWQKLLIPDVAHEIIRKKRQMGWRIDKCYIDPFSKGDDKIAQSRLGQVESAYEIIRKILLKEDIILDVADKAKTSGILLVQEALEGIAGMPTFFVFDHCRRFRYEIKKYIWKDGYPIDEDDHMMENTYRYLITKPRYVSRESLTCKQEPVLGIV